MQIPLRKLRQRAVHLKPFDLLPKMCLPPLYTPPQFAHSGPKNPRHFHWQYISSRIRLWLFEIVSQMQRGIT